MRGRKLEQARFIVYSTTFRRSINKELNKIKDYIKENETPNREFWKKFNARVDKFYEDTAKLYAQTFTQKELKHFYEMMTSKIGYSVYLRTLKLAKKGYELGNELVSDLLSCRERVDL